ncbi:MAG: Fe-S cluster assembly protein HesB [Actinomycetota bacterium]|nr:Fe-S cluster assembly protein HesB [Actinomycetota bacterium]
MTSTTLKLRGAGGEPVDLWRTIMSHGVASLPPMFIEEDARTLTATVPLPQCRPRTVKISEGRSGRARIEFMGSAPSERTKKEVVAAVKHILALDRDMSDFYDVATQDPDLAWAATGAGRMIRSATVFEDVVKTICTTNCAWSGTERMVGALVEHLGETAPGAPKTGPQGRAFPTPDVMARAGENWYREVARAGYRGAYLIALARGVADGAIDLEELGNAPPDAISDDEVEESLLALPGVGPYAAAHIMMILGRHSRLILDSWTRPKFARLVGKKKVPDSTIVRRFKRYGPHAGLAFWLFLTKDWVVDPA